jgi:hypothetical protein
MKERGVNLEAKVRRDHPMTAKAAANSISPWGITVGQQKIFDALSMHRDGLTDEEICEVTGLEGSSERPRRIELWEHGWVEDAGERRATRRGRKAIVWRLR